MADHQLMRRHPDRPLADLCVPLAPLLVFHQELVPYSM